MHRALGKQLTVPILVTQGRVDPVLPLLGAGRALPGHCRAGPAGDVQLRARADAETPAAWQDAVCGSSRAWQPGLAAGPGSLAWQPGLAAG